MKKVKAIYIGERQLSDVKLGSAYLIGDKAIYFRRNHFSEIGREYWVEKSKTGFHIGRIPEAVDENAEVKDDLRAKEWKAAECAARNKVRYAAAARKAAKNPEFASIAARIAYACKGLSYFEIAAVVDYLTCEAAKKNK